MGAISDRTKTLLILVLVNFVIGESESDVGPNTIDLNTADLLRDDDHRPEVHEDIAGGDDETLKSEEINTKPTIAFYNTTEYTEAVGVKDRDSEESSDYPDEDQSKEEAVTSSEATETTDYTFSSINNNVYRDQEDIYTNASHSDIDVKTEITSTEATTKAMDNEDPVAVRTPLDEDLDIQGQRNPKTENSEANQSNEARNYDNNLRPPPKSKSSTLRGWLEDSWLRPPAGILVPLRPMALNRALAVWNDLAVEGLNVSDIVIVGYDSNGINWRSRHSLQPSSSGTRDRNVSEALSKLLLKYQGVHTDEASDGTMRALASAAKLVPYDSALFVVTDKGAGDPQRLPLALRTLVEKRLKVYTIWTDPNHPSADSESALQELKNISEHTEGDVLAYSMQVMDVDSASNLASEAELQQWEPLELRQARKGRINSEVDIENFDTLLVRRGGGEAISLGLPIENGVTALRVFIEGAVEHAVLYPPNDAPQIDLYNSSSVTAFSPASRTAGLSPRDVYLVFPGAELDMEMLSVLPANPTRSDAHSAMVGVWHLSVRCETCDYRLCVAAQAQIHFDVRTDNSDKLKLRVTGPVATVRESLLVDEYGTELAKLSFSYQPMAGDIQTDQINPSTELVDEVALPSVKGSRVYVKIVGRDVGGVPFVRLAGPINQPEVRMGRSASLVFPDALNDLQMAEAENVRAYSRLIYNSSDVLPFSRAVSQVVNQRGSLLTAVQIGLSTRLYGSPGDNLQLHFEVTNYREQSVRFSFGAVGELRFLTGINPTSQVIASGQTANVIVSVSITSTAQPGARDLITFTAYGIEQVSISAYVYVTNPGDTTSDVWAPELRHNFQGTCIGKMGADCAEHSWSATIVARDAVGGLLRLASSPIGLAYDSNFISGSRDEVVATYRATCCAPRVMVNAVDAFGNTNSYVVDISSYYTAAGIAAIVLGVILAIALLAVIIFLIYWCVRRRQESRDLPYTTSSRNMS